MWTQEDIPLGPRGQIIPVGLSRSPHPRISGAFRTQPLGDRAIPAHRFAAARGCSGGGTAPAASPRGLRSPRSRKLLACAGGHAISSCAC